MAAVCTGRWGKSHRLYICGSREVTQQRVFPIDSTDDINLDVVLSSETEGKYYLNIFVSVIGKASTPISRVFALAVYVGDVTTDKKSNRTKIEADGGIILVPVTEKTRS